MTLALANLWWSIIILFVYSLYCTYCNSKHQKIYDGCACLLFVSPALCLQSITFAFLLCILLFLNVYVFLFQTAHIISFSDITDILCQQVQNGSVAILYFTNTEEFGRRTAASQYFLQMAGFLGIPVIAWNADNAGFESVSNSFVLLKQPYVVSMKNVKRTLYCPLTVSFLHLSPYWHCSIADNIYGYPICDVFDQHAANSCKLKMYTVGWKLTP